MDRSSGLPAALAVSAATLAPTSLMFAVVGGVFGSVANGVIGGALWIAAVFELRGLSIVLMNSNRPRLD